ncbi:MAG TPA: AI-2E family transporter [Gemmataceae bacterium]|nr:AI-2E family transporter [Gemmataceae bacterium]
MTEPPRVLPPHPAPPVSTAEAPSLATAARWVVIVVGAYFLLRELGDILKPLFVAILLGYVILPAHLWVKRHVPGRRLSILASAILSLAILFVVTAIVQSSVRTLSAEVPKLTAEVREQIKEWQGYFERNHPATWKQVSGLAFPEQTGDGPARDLATRFFGVAADTVSTAAVVGLYLLFLLLEAGRFPDRVRKAFSEPRAERVMATIAGINRGIAHFLTAKVKSSLLLAVPVFVLLFVFQTRYALIWAAFTFFCNFIPYLGSVAAYSLPTLFVIYQFGVGWESVTIAILLLAIHLVSASVVEPAILGKAVGVSPVVILFALAFWGSVWGLMGLLLAVPLTVLLKIIAEHIDATRPLAKLVSDE